jgi:hypothetical protein
VRLLAAVCLVAALGAARPAHATGTKELKSIGTAALYLVPTGGAVFAGAVDALYWSSGEGAPRRWRIAGWAFGGAAMLVGGYVLYTDGVDTTRGLVTGLPPLILGAGAITCATFVGAPDDIVGNAAIAPLWIADHGRLELAGVSFAGRF